MSEQKENPKMKAVKEEVPTQKEMAEAKTAPSKPELTLDQLLTMASGTILKFDQERYVGLYLDVVAQQSPGGQFNMLKVMQNIPQSFTISTATGAVITIMSNRDELKGKFYEYLYGLTGCTEETSDEIYEDLLSGKIQIR